MTSIDLPEYLESIGDYAFYNCTGLTSIVIPEYVREIQTFAFYQCKNLKKVINESSLTFNEGKSGYGYVSYYATKVIQGERKNGFYFSINSSGVCYLDGYVGDEVNVILPETYNGQGYFIASNAFIDCRNVISVTIPSSVSAINGGAFSGVFLRTIVCLNPAPILFSTSTSNLSFDTNTFNHATLYVPEGSYWDYAYSSWGSFIHMKEMAMKEDALESRKAYMIADASGCNYTVYDAGKDELVNVEYTFALDEENEGSCWTVMKEGEKSYLYNIGAKKFADMDEEGNISLSDSPVVLDISTTESGLCINGKARMFVLNDKVDVDVTAINDVLIDGNAADRNAPVYNLQGMKMQDAENLPKGIYVKNGKKFVVK